MAKYVTAIRTKDGPSQIDYNALANLPKSDSTLTKSGSFADAKATGDAIKNHTHSASNISQGTLPLSRGGTGVSADSASGLLEALGCIEMIQANGADYDMDVIIKSGSHRKLYRIGPNTLNTPYTEQLSDGFSYGLILSFSVSPTSARQIAIYAGQAGGIFERRLYNDQISDWRKFSFEGHTHSASDITSADASEHPYAILRLSSDPDTYPRAYYVDTASGAMYATADKGMPKFGTLPVDQGGTGATSPEQARKNIGAAATGYYTATLSKSKWGSSVPYTQSVTINGILASDNPTVDIDLSSATTGTISDLKTSWSSVDRIVTEANKITAYCYEEKPVVDMKIRLMVVR